MTQKCNGLVFCKRKKLKTKHDSENLILQRQYGALINFR